MLTITPHQWLIGLLIVVIIICVYCRNELFIAAAVIAGSYIGITTLLGDSQFEGGYKYQPRKGLLSRLFGSRNTTTAQRWAELNLQSLGNFDFVVRYWRDLIEGALGLTNSNGRPPTEWLTDPAQYKLSLAEEMAILFDFAPDVGVPGERSWELLPSLNTEDKWAAAKAQKKQLRNSIYEIWYNIGGLILQTHHADEMTELAEKLRTPHEHLPHVADDKDLLNREIESMRHRLISRDVISNRGFTVRFLDNLRAHAGNYQEDIAKKLRQLAELKVEKADIISEATAALTELRRNHSHLFDDSALAGKLTLLNHTTMERDKVIKDITYQKQTINIVKRRLISQFAKLLTDNRDQLWQEYVLYELAFGDLFNKFEGMVGDSYANRGVLASDTYATLPARHPLQTIAEWRRHRLAEMYDMAEQVVIRNSSRDFLPTLSPIDTTYLPAAPPTIS